MVRITVMSLKKRFEKFENLIRTTTIRILKVLKKDNIWLEIYLINSPKIKFLNKKFRKKDKISGVLSFKEPKNFPHPEIKLRLRDKKLIKFIGEVYLNPDFIKQKTEKRIKEKLIYLLIHGLLHLFDYGHQKKSDRIKMEKMEQYLISNF
jgi:probable rRNA maturation factor